MARKKVTLSDGRIMTLEVPDGTTDDQIREFVASQSAAPTKPEKKKGIWEKITGAGREDYPEITEMKGIPMGKAAGILMSHKNEQVMDILKSQFGDAIAFGKDKSGEDFAELAGKRYYINKPGLSTQDVLQTVGQGAALVAAAIPASRIASLPLRSAAMAGTGAATAVGQDVATMAAGSKQGVDLPYAATVGAGAGAGEFVAPIFSPVANVARRAVSRLTGKQALVEGGKITQAGARAIEQAGFDPASVPDEAAAQFAKMVQDAVDPKEAIAYLQSKALPVNVPLRRGHITQNPRQQMVESQAGKGVYGEKAGQIIRDSDEAIKQSLLENERAIQAQVGGGTAKVTTKGEGAAAALESLTTAKNEMKKNVDAAYDAARAARGGVTESEARGVATAAQGKAADYLRYSDKAKTELDELFALSRTDGPASIPSQQLFDWRRRVTNLANTAADPTDRAALKAMRDAFDESAVDMLRRSVVSGDKEAIKAWQTAIKARKEYGDVFQGKGIVPKLLEKATPENAISIIFGAGKSGLISNRDMAGNLAKLRGTLDRDAWNGLKEEAFLRLTEFARGGMVGGEQGYSGAVLKKAWLEMNRNNKPAVNVLFNSDEQKLIQNFVDVAARATNPAKGGENLSNTTAALTQWINSLGPGARTRLQAIFPSVMNAVDVGKATKAVGYVPRGGGMPPTIGALIGGGTAQAVPR